MTLRFRCEKGHLFDSDYPDEDEINGFYMFGCKQFAYCAFCECRKKGLMKDEDTGEILKTYCILLREKQ